MEPWARHDAAPELGLEELDPANPCRLLGGHRLLRHGSVHRNVALIARFAHPARTRRRAATQDGRQVVMRFDLKGKPGSREPPCCQRHMTVY